MKQYSGFLPHPILSLFLVGVWLLLNQTVSTAHLLLGSFLGVVIPLLTARFWPERVRIRRPLTLLRFVATVLGDILIANLAVAKRILGPPSRLKPAFVELPLRLRGELAISILANTISLTPGTVSAYLSRDRRTLLIHALDVDDTDALLAAIRSRYERPLLEVFEP